jgi:hypothetical protein
MLSRLIYASVVADDLRADELNRMLEHARLRNALRGITGMLAFDSRSFLQVLEGSRKALSDLYAAILRDPRHRGVQLLKFARIETRLFPDWSMGFMPADLTHRAMLVRHAPTPHFDPGALDGESAEALLVAFRAALADRTAPLPLA